MGLFVSGVKDPDRREMVIGKWKEFSRLRIDSQDNAVADFVDELLADADFVSSISAEARRTGREDGFVEAAGIMSALLEMPERPVDMEGAKMAMVSISDQISEFLPLRWRPVSELPDEGVFIGWNDGCDFFWIGRHDGEKRCYSLDALVSGGNIVRVYPAHFMPLPKAPGGAWDADLEELDLSGCRWLVDALAPFSDIAGLLRRFANKTRLEEVQINPMLNLFVTDFERAEKALDRLRILIGAGPEGTNP